MDFESQGGGLLGIVYSIVRSSEKNDGRKKRRGDTGSLDSCILHSSGFGLSVLVLQPIDVYIIVSVDYVAEYGQVK